MPGGEAGAQRGKWRRRRRPVPLPQSPFLVRVAVLVGEDPGGSIGSDPTRTGDRVCFGLVRRRRHHLSNASARTRRLLEMELAWHLLRGPGTTKTPPPQWCCSTVCKTCRTSFPQQRRHHDARSRESRRPHLRQRVGGPLCGRLAGPFRHQLQDV